MQHMPYDEAREKHPDAFSHYATPAWSVSNAERYEDDLKCFPEWAKRFEVNPEPGEAAVKQSAR
jgi:hypothetical protein